ncbi:MAG: hypothetical protein WBE18_07315, partial [Gammaproteobacteria bacterium]
MPAPGTKETTTKSGPQVTNPLPNESQVPDSMRAQARLNELIKSLYEEEGLAVLQDKEFYAKFKQAISDYIIVATDKRRDKKTSKSHLDAAQKISHEMPKTANPNDNQLVLLSGAVKALLKSGEVREFGFWDEKESDLHRLLTAYQEWFSLKKPGSRTRIDLAQENLNELIKSLYEEEGLAVLQDKEFYAKF